MVRIGDVRALCWFYNVDAETIDALANMALGTLEQNWRETSNFAVPEWPGLYVGLESTAAEIRLYEPELIHGVFQTADYARAVHEAVRPEASFGRHRSRDRVPVTPSADPVFRVPPPQTIAVFSEGVFVRKVGGASAMARQMVRIRELAARKHVEARILPWFADAHAAMTGSFAIFDFEDNDDPSVAYVGFQTGARYLEKPAKVVEHRRIFDLVLERTIPIEEYLS